LTVEPKPAQAAMDVWLGGQSAVELRRCGRLGDGWLPSFCLPADVAAGIPVIEAAAAEAGRAIDPEHYGVLVAYLPPGVDPGISEQYAARVAARRPGLDPTALLPAGHDAVRQRLEGFIEVGASKFVLVPIGQPPSWPDELGELAATVQTLLRGGG
jgi:alkanesulfonate monooxygenase SsuD/methylene tetrahydromethanopterin reductase-like flavin-dependent oxidoreductase (luciferase family)